MAPALARDLGAGSKNPLDTQSSQTEKMSDGSIRAGDHKAFPLRWPRSELRVKSFTNNPPNCPHLL